MINGCGPFVRVDNTAMGHVEDIHTMTIKTSMYKEITRLWV